jgi:hypothetical protein
MADLPAGVAGGGARARVGSARGWRRPALQAALAWWGAAPLPVLFGPLSDCDHCTRVWLQMLPVHPGVVPAVVFGCTGLGFFVVALVFTAFAIWCTSLWMRTAGRRWALVAAPILLVQGALDFGLAFALRA